MKPILGRGTWCNKITTYGLYWKHFQNITEVTKPIPLDILIEDKFFGAH